MIEMSKGAEKILREPTHEWIVERIDRTDGTLIYIEGAEFPQKGIPTAEALYGVSLTKKMMLSIIKTFSIPVFYPSFAFIALSPRKFIQKTLDIFNDISRSTLDPYRLPPKEMCIFARELQLMITMFLFEMGYSYLTAFTTGQDIGLIFDYDMAYRWRIQDILSETTPDELFTWKGLNRLSKLIGERDEARIANEAKRLITLLKLSLLYPKVKKILCKVLTESNFSHLQFDEADRYWCCFRTDYRFFGMTVEERMRLVDSKGWKIPVGIPIMKESTALETGQPYE